MKKKSEPAFPIKGFCADASGALAGEVIEHKGMTLRDWFAGQALAASGWSLWDQRCGMNAEIANKCYGKADAMMEERRK